MKIHFQNPKDLDYIYNFLENTHVGFHMEKKPLQLEIHMNTKDHQRLVVLHKAIKKLILDKKRFEWMQKILEDDFFYQDFDEQTQIIEIAYSIIEGKRKDLIIDLDFSNDERQVDLELQEVLTTASTLSLDAFITFRLRFYLEKIPTLIEIAIDEYKLEQEYQMFLQYLRDFLKGRKPQMECVYIVDNDGFIFFDENRKEIQQADLYKRIDRRLLFSHPVYVDSSTIAPLISIAPKQIYLFTDQTDSGIIQTLKNIFEEKIEIQPLEQFYKTI